MHKYIVVKYVHMTLLGNQRMCGITWW